MLDKLTDENRTIAILMSVRDEETYIDLNISYHLDLGFDYIFVANHCSTDGTNKILDLYKDDPRVVVIEETDKVFDHARITNKLLKYANENYNIDWFAFLDADEFLSVKDENIHEFVGRLEQEQIPYATIGWANALFDYTFSDFRCSPVHAVDTMKYYYPWPEKDWQEYGHFRKAIVKNHENMEIVVGGHYVRTENNPEFFGEYDWNPFIVPKEEAKLLHFEFRWNAEDIYKKWEKLAAFEHDSTSEADAPWLERIETIRNYVELFKNNVEEINKRWFFEHRTFWGTIIHDERVVYDTTLLIWYRKYFRRKLESREVSSVCLVRSGHFGDVIMSEPIARFLRNYVPEVSLVTDVQNASKILTTYNKFYSYSNFLSEKHECDISIRLVYELSDNKKTYIQSFMDSIGFDDMHTNDLPVIKDSWPDIIGEEYILIAPVTSKWDEQRRSWGYENFSELSKLLEEEYGLKCVLLEEKYSFEEMLSLIRHCKFFVGNDSGPANIAFAFEKKAFVIFGSTHPKYLNMPEDSVPVYDENRHKLCIHTTREEEMDCCEEFCMERIRVRDVFKQIKLHT